MPVGAYETWRDAVLDFLHVRVAPAAAPAVAPNTQAKTQAQALKAVNFNPVTTGPLAPQFNLTDPAVTARVTFVKASALGLVDGLKAMMISGTCADMDVRPTFYGYETGKAMTMSIRRKLKDNRLDFVLAMNVSAHDFRHSVESGGQTRAWAQEQLLARANDNQRYVIKVTTPDGVSQEMTGIVANGAVVTVQGISAFLQPGTNVIEAWPEQSCMVGGYMEGRRIEVAYNP